MDKVNINNIKHEISIKERNNIIISGLKKIESFDNEEFLVETVMGFMLIKGDNLEIIKLDTYQGNITIKGKVNALTYVEDLNKKEKEAGVFNRLFK